MVEQKNHKEKIESTVKISESDDYEALVEMFIRNDLEFSDEIENVSDLVKYWKAVDTSMDNKLIGGCVLALHEGKYIIDGIATEPEYRNMELGKSLLNLAVEEVRRLKGRELYLVARAPSFFKKQGFVEVEREKSPSFFECFTCDQYNVNCFPEVMRLDIN